jgi:hypothetical protein
MPTLDEVKEQLNRLDTASAVLARKEIRELPNILWEGEAIRGAAQGVYNSHIGILVATDRRLIFVDKGMISLKVEDFPYDKVSSIQYQTGWIFGDITIFASGNRAQIKQIPKDAARAFAETVRNMISGGAPAPQAPPQSAPAPQAAGAGDDFMEKLEKLARLKEQGILTDEEFAEQKAKVLAAMIR